jgi:hypothetical protein
MAALPEPSAAAADEVDELIGRIGSLVRVRAIFRRAGFEPHELRRIDLEIERLHWRLAGAALRLARSGQDAA